VGVPPPINTQIEPSSASSSSGGGLKGITASEIQAMKAIFDVFDEDRDGLISVTDLAKLCDGIVRSAELRSA
jgi:Ca2+-binding EF-hand superfamily protein